MSKEEKRSFIRALLSEVVYVKGINCTVSLGEMFSRYSNAVVVLRQKNGKLLAIGF